MNYSNEYLDLLHKSLEGKTYFVPPFADKENIVKYLDKYFEESFKDSILKDVFGIDSFTENLTKKEGNRLIMVDVPIFKDKSVIKYVYDTSKPGCSPSWGSFAHLYTPRRDILDNSGIVIEIGKVWLKPGWKSVSVIPLSKFKPEYRELIQEQISNSYELFSLSKEVKQHQTEAETIEDIVSRFKTTASSL